jgi:hypothetical protein
MTAEIAILNKEAVALAADSAVTIEGKAGEKIFTSANKLFALSKYRPVGVMVYGNALLMSVPWETIIKVYRNKLGKKKFDKLEEYANDLIVFLDHEYHIFPDFIQKDYVNWSIYAYFNLIREEVKRKSASIINSEGELSTKQVEQLVSDIIEKHCKHWRETDTVSSLPNDFAETIIDKYSEIIDIAIKKVFEKLPISEAGLKCLREIASSLFSKFPEEIEKQYVSGIVVAGFGENDTFPSVQAFDIEGVVNNRLIYREVYSRHIDLMTTAAVMPFGQRDMVSTFMEGIDPDLEGYMTGYLSEIFDKYPETILSEIRGIDNDQRNTLTTKLKKASKKIFKDYQEAMGVQVKNDYVNPVIKVVEILPKNELAEMAESLVSLTSFKRKVSMEKETVGGPVDVAVISKGDGFIWIKRKHYFKGEFNPQFFANYYMECGDGQE